MKTVKMRALRLVMALFLILLAVCAVPAVRADAAGKAACRISVTDGKKRRRIPLQAQKSAETSVKTKMVLSPGDNSISVRAENRKGSVRKAYFQVYDSQGRQVFRSTTVKGKSAIWTWNGMPSSGNKTDLPSSEYVPEGSYKIRIIVKFRYWGRNYTAKRNVWITVKKGSDTPAPEYNGFNAQNQWPWQVMLLGDARTDYLAEVVCQQTLLPSMTEYERARALFIWVEKHVLHEVTAWSAEGALMDSTSPQAEANIAAYDAAPKSSVGVSVYTPVTFVSSRWAYLGFTMQKGDCLVHSSTLQALLLHAGISSEILENARPRGNGHHYWNTVCIGGVWYQCDTDVYPGTENLSRFLLGRRMNRMRAYNPIKDEPGYNAAYALVSRKNYAAS